MRITALSATALAVAALGGAPALAAIPQAPASIAGPASASEPVASPTPSADASPTAEPTSDPTSDSTPEPNPEPSVAPTSGPTPTAEPTPDRRTSPNTESTPEPSDEPSPVPSPDPTSEPTPKSTEDPGLPVKRSTVESRGEWYRVMVDDKPAPEGTTFSAVERNPDGTVTTHDFIIGEDGQVFRVDTSKSQNRGEAVDPRKVTLKVENGSVEFINEPTPTPPVSPTPPPDNQTPPGDDDATQRPPRPKPPLTEPPVQDPPEEDGRQPGERPGEHPGERQPGERPGNQDEGDTDNGSNGQEKPEDEDGNNSDAKDRTQDPDTGNGTVPGQAGADWTPGNSGDEKTREPDYSDPVPQNPDDAGEVSQDIIAGPEPSQENHDGSPTAPSSDGEDTAVDAADTGGSFPWSLAVLLGTGVVGLLLAVFLFARRKSED